MSDGRHWYNVCHMSDGGIGTMRGTCLMGGIGTMCVTCLMAALVQCVARV